MHSQSPMPANTAAWSVSPRARLSVGPAPYTPPGEGEIVIRNRAVAINPVDWALASLPFISQQVAPWMKRPAVLGEDLAGEVAEVGAGVTRFKPGDRVLAFAAGGNQNRNRAAEGAFQTYVVALAHMASPIPDAMSFEDAAVLPLGLSTRRLRAVPKGLSGASTPLGRRPANGQDAADLGRSQQRGLQRHPVGRQRRL